MTRTVISRLILALSMGTPADQPAGAETLTFELTCDNNWQSCCGCQSNMMCLNWNRPPTPEPVCPSLPSVADDVIIGIDCTILPAPAPAAMADELEQTGGTLTVAGNLRVNSATLGGSVDWQRGSIDRIGTFAILNINGEMAITGSDPKSLGAFGAMLLVNNGTTTWTGDGSWTISQAPCNCSPAVFHNTLGSLLEVQSDAAIDRVSFGLGRMDNDGMIVRNTSPGVSEWDVYLDNSGTVHLQSGTLRLIGNGESTGELRADSGASLVINTVGFAFNEGASITGNGDIIIEDAPGAGNTAVFNGTTQIDRMSILAGVSIGGTAEMVIHDQLILQGPQQIAAPIHVLAGGQMVATGGVQSNVRNTSIEGTATAASGSTLRTVQGQMVIEAGGAIELVDGGTVAVSGAGSAPIENFGTVHKLAGAGTATMLGGFGRNFNNNAGGLVHAAAGTIEYLDLNVFSNGSWQADAGATIEFNTDATMDLDSTWTGTGRYLVASPDLDNVLRIADGVHLTPHDLQLGDATRSARVLDLGGSIGDLTVTGAFRFIGGELDAEQALDLTIAPGGTLTFENTTLARMGATNLTLGGTATVMGTAAVDMRQSPTWTIEKPGILDIQSDVVIGNFIAFPTIENSGTVVKSAGAGTATIIFPNVDNTGTVRVESGTLMFDANQLGGFIYSQTTGVTEVAGGALIVDAIMNLEGGTLQGAGAVSANPNNSGATVRPGASAGTLLIASNVGPTIAGNYTQGAGGTLEIELGGLTPDSEHDQLIVAGTANLNGVLRLMPIDGYIPQIGDAFVVLTANSRIGAFSHVIGPGAYSVTYNPTNVVVTATASPACSDLSPADLNFDCAVDLADHELLYACLDGPAVDASPVNCLDAQSHSGDLDFDDDVDLADYQVFQTLFAGP